MSKINYNMSTYDNMVVGDKKMEKIIIGATAMAATVASIGILPLQFL